MRHAILVLWIVLAVGTAFASQPGGRTLTFEERVAAQKAIEQVYWNHRIWPKENPGPKPPLSVVMSDDAIRAKVEDYLKKSNALERFWQHPVTTEQLQAELNRMVTNTRDGRVLGELFAALANNPLVIAETLVRRSLVDRLIHNWYASDTRFHGDLKKRAESTLASCGNLACMKAMAGEYNETTWVLRSDEANSPDESHDGHVIRLDADEWNEYRDRLARQLGGSRYALPLQTWGRLEETPEGFSAIALLAQRGNELTTASAIWKKRSFDTWWGDQRAGLDSKLELMGGTIAIPAVPVTPCTNDTWTPSRYEVPSPRYGQSAVWTGTEMIVWGGYDGNYLNTGGRYMPSIDSWIATTGVDVPLAREYAATVWTGTEMIVWGGDLGFYFGSGGRYNPGSDSWTATSTGINLPTGRELSTAVWTGSEMIVWGGYNGACLNTGGRYNPTTNSWAATSTGVNVPGARCDHSAVWTGAEMIVWGGYIGTYLNGTDYNTGGRYNPTTDSWIPTSTGANVPDARRDHAAIWTGTEMVVWGGYVGTYVSGTYFNTGARYDPVTDSWTTTSTGVNVPDARGLPTAVWTGNEMIVWGGLNHNARYQSGGRYDPSTDSWAATSTGTNVPAGRYLHSAVWTGTEMIVWGGYSYFSVTNTGGRYDPATDRWLATASDRFVMERRFKHTAVWTGTEMIVWGGYANSDSYFNSGGRYNPSTDSWVPTSTGTNVPAGRFGHTAIWTGTEMIVWGGHSFYPTTGGRYNPTTDSWTTTSTDPGATPREDSSAIWTGEEMIVWGGILLDQGTHYLNTGERYNPTTDSWKATTTGQNVPIGRAYHAAVWTGTEMIVWGGFTGDIATNTGGRYDPLADSWASTSLATDVPEARTHATGVWTGTEMIIWGGGTLSGTSFRTGGRYNPSTNTWAPTSTASNCPSARSLHTAVWTAKEMIIWGGVEPRPVRPYSANTNTGARYDPSTDSWVATSTGQNVPEARTAHTAIWTGSEMLIWGGSADAFLNTGGATAPAPAAGFTTATPTVTASVIRASPSQAATARHLWDT